MCHDFPHFLIFTKVNFYDMLWKFTEINQNVSITSIYLHKKCCGQIPIHWKFMEECYHL